jgi:hypothetical protein
MFCSRVQEVIGYTPLQLQILYICVFVAIGVISAAAMVLGKKMGRVQTIILCSYLSYSFYTAIILGAVFGYWNIPILMGALYVFRASLANGAAPLHQSIVDDYVDSKVSISGVFFSLFFFYK